jgi:hypothetical protein
MAICLAVLLASVLLPLPKNGSILGLPSPCPFFHFTGWPCGSCGLTRAFVCCGHGRFAEAFVWHPLGPPLFIATIFVAIALLFGVSLKPRDPILSFCIAALVFGVFWALRLGGVFPLPKATDVVRLR